MGKTRGFLRKIRDTKGTVHAKMGTVKDRSSMDLRGAEVTCIELVKWKTWIRT